VAEAEGHSQVLKVGLVALVVVVQLEVVLHLVLGVLELLDKEILVLVEMEMFHIMAVVVEVAMLQDLHLQVELEQQSQLLELLHFMQGVGVEGLTRETLLL
jgi:hypothetical protein